MAKEWEKRTFVIRDLIDKELLQILNKEKTISSFNKLLDNVLTKLSIRIDSTNARPQLSIYCDKDVDGYGIITYLWFYINELISLHYIAFVILPGNKGDITLGQSKALTSGGFLSVEISEFITSEINCNIVINPIIKDYIEAGHQSLELYEAKKSRHIAFWSFLIATISALLSAISLFSR